MENKVKISTQNLNLYYGENHALKNINLDIEKGQYNCCYSDISMLSCRKNMKRYLKKI